MKRSRINCNYGITAQNLILSVVASLASILLIRWWSEPIPGFTSFVAKWLAAALVLTCAGIWLSGLNRYTRRVTTLASMARVVLMVSIKDFGMAALFPLGIIRFETVSMNILSLFLDAALTAVLFAIVHFYTLAVTRNATARVYEAASRRNAVVWGTGEASISLARSILSEDRYNLAGFLSDNKSLAGMVIEDRIVYYCPDRNDLSAIDWRIGGIDCIFFPPTPPNVKPTEESAAETSSNMPESDGMSFVGKAFKRSFDLIFSLILTVVFAPLALICAIAIKWEDGGPVFYTQERIGRNGRTFKIIKFRSMKVDAEPDGAMLYQGKDDPRLTRVGAFLRNHHLDELPQLINVLKGDMSFIGYRPERQVYIEQIMAVNPRYRYLYKIRPGITSYATLYNGYTDTLEKMMNRLDLDLYYLRNHSVGFDIYVLGMTFLKIVTGKEF